MDEKSFECYLCHIKITSSLSHLIRHMRIHKSACFFECPHTKCKKTFTRKYSLRIHYKKAHGDVEFPKKLKKVTTKSYLKTRVKSYQCSMCNKLIRHGKANLRRHMENVHKIVSKKPKKINTNRGRVRTRYVCLCQKVFTTKNAINDHVTSVHGGDRYVCTICYPRTTRPGAVFFTSKRALLQHCNRANHEAPDIVEPFRAVMHHWNSEEST